MKKILQFFKNSFAELKKVVWPSRSEVVSSTKVVIVSTIIFAAVLGLVDFLLIAGLDLLFQGSRRILFSRGIIRIERTWLKAGMLFTPIPVTRIRWRGTYEN